MATTKRFNYAEGKRIELTKQQEKQIKETYETAHENIIGRIEWLEGNDNPSLQRLYLQEIEKDLTAEISRASQKLQSTITNNMSTVSQAAVTNNNTILKELGFNATGYVHVPNDVVQDLVTGKMYEGRWSLSKAIWSDNQKTLLDIRKVIAVGTSEGKSAYDIAKELEKYVNPNMAKDWQWSKVYPGTRRVVDYNAQRLARTMISHAYQESFVRTTINNPFFDAYEWLTSNSDRVCPLCIERVEKDEYGLGAGIFPKDKLPFDHPNGMCTYAVVMSNSYDDIADSLVDWYNGTGNEELNDKLNTFVDDMLNI